MPHSFTLSRRALFVGAAVIALAPAAALAAKQNLSSGVAISGYDPVAYFTENAAVKGDANITADHQGATYQFSSAANRDAFLAEPEKFAPKYGGFCAYAVSQGYTAPIDPEAFSVVDNALYLNFSKGVRTRWSNDIPGNISKGDANWPDLSGQ